LGVPSSDMLLESRSHTTWQNAQFAREPLERLGADRIWLVTSAHHLRRAVFAFRRFGLRVTPVRADYLRGVWSLVPSAYNLYVTDAALHEYVGMALYHWYAWRGRIDAPPENGGPPNDLRCRSPPLHVLLEARAPPVSVRLQICFRGAQGTTA
jgi:uncharacterized SAM-binding protein YcdF (DUF218 family)